MENTIELTKEQRHEVYIKTLIQMQKEVVLDEGYYGFCYSISIVTGRKLETVDLRDYPEINKHRPEGKTNKDRWFSPWDYESRFKILQQCIEETK